MQGDRYLGSKGAVLWIWWDYGGDHVGLPSSLGIVHNYVALVLGNLVLILGSEGGGRHHMQVVVHRA